MTQYNFIDPDRPKKKREAQSTDNEAVDLEEHPEVRRRSFIFDRESETDVEEIIEEIKEQEEEQTDKVGGENNSIVNKVVSLLGGLLK